MSEPTTIEELRRYLAMASAPEPRIYLASPEQGLALLRQVDPTEAGYLRLARAIARMSKTPLRYDYEIEGGSLLVVSDYVRAGVDDPILSIPRRSPFDLLRGLDAERRESVLASMLPARHAEMQVCWRRRIGGL